MTTVTFEVPEELVDDLDLGSPEQLAAQARRAFVLDLLREGRISRGRAAQVLGLTRYAIHDLIAQQQIPSGPSTAEEVDRDLRNAELGLVLARDAGD